MALQQPFVDGNFTFPVEVEGSPSIAIDEITRAMIITRKFCILRDFYSPLPQGTIDYQYKDSFLINEVQAQQQGPMLWFNRIFAQIPQARVEPREVSFTQPGRSAAQISKATLKAIGWNPYGASAPLTTFQLATATFTYALQTSLTEPPASLFPAVPTVSVLQFNGSPVDFTGQVYVNVGQVTEPSLINPGTNVTETRWNLVGIVGGFFPGTGGKLYGFASGGDWIYSTAITRWRGPIFALEIVKIPNVVLPP